MDLFEAHRKGLPLVAETEHGGARLIAEIFPSNVGVLFVDTGWPTATSHPIHTLDGRIMEDENGWLVGDTRIRIVFEGEPLFENWQAWRRYREGEGKVFDRERCYAEVGKFLDLASA